MLDAADRSCRLTNDDLKTANDDLKEADEEFKEVLKNLKHVEHQNRNNIDYALALCRLHWLKSVIHATTLWTSQQVCNRCVRVQLYIAAMKLIERGKSTECICVASTFDLTGNM